MKFSPQVHDKRVAGVVSCAGGVDPRLTLQQEGSLAGGQHLALTGKVYALAWQPMALLRRGISSRLRALRGMR